MNLLKDCRVIEYISSLDGMNPVQYLPTVCQCIKENISKDAHSSVAVAFSSNLAKLAAHRDPKTMRLIVMYITNLSYFDGDTMKFLVNEMLESKDIETVEQYYNVLDTNFMLHPPCAQYMVKEYEQFLLSSYKSRFGEMSLWDYIITCLSKITIGSLVYGQNKVIDLAFKRCFSFCITILQFDFEVSKKKNIRPLVAKCLKYKLERRTRMSEITKLLDMSFSTANDFQMSIIHLAMLVSQLKLN